MNLYSKIEDNFRLLEIQKKALKRLDLKSVRDLLFYFPTRYESFSERKNIDSLVEGDKTTVFGKIIIMNLQKTSQKKISLAKATVGDMTGTINVTWFNQPYIAKILKTGDKVALTGKVTKNKSGLLYLANPIHEKISSYDSLGEGASILPIYPETRGLTSRWLRFTIQKILKSVPAHELQEIIPEEILKKYHLPHLYSSLIYIHTPQNIKDAEIARKRFSFEEIFFIQLQRLRQRLNLKKKSSHIIKTTKKDLNNFLKIFPFKLTGSQKKSINQIIEDFKKDEPMSRLLEGDVGSGKTAVAVAATYVVAKNQLETAYMAPTEILAQQHFKSFIDYFSKLNLGIKIGLITSSECRKFPSKVNPNDSTPISKNQLLKWVANGEIPVLIGTHSLIQGKVKFKDLALVIIDEQHRFGTKQRMALLQKKTERIPHLLSMTATPIPRTLALTMYGDLDLSLLDTMPLGRKKIITISVPPEQRDHAYEQIRDEINNGRQAYIICPRIDEPDPEKLGSLNLKAVKAEAKRLKKEVFPEFEIDMLYGKMNPKEKENALEDFRKNKTQILIATSVIEVGIDIPNATMIIIEGAERFGLAQLHQLRGRVMRSSYQSYCFVFTESNSQKTKDRLKALEKAKNGFELAEFDLQFRGAGELSGMKQWGISDIGMEALKNLKMVEAARSESQNILNDDPELKKYPTLAQRLSLFKNDIHFE